VKVIDENTIGINETTSTVELTPFPNPAKNILRIPLKGLKGPAILRIFAMDGTLVSEQKVASSGLESIAVDVAAVSAGTYLFHLEFESGERSDFRVVVAK
jgi:hypothetical protein